MNEWVSVKTNLPERNETVYAKDDTGHIFKAVYMGPVVGWINVKELVAAYVTHWCK